MVNRAVDIDQNHWDSIRNFKRESFRCARVFLKHLVESDCERPLDVWHDIVKRCALGSDAASQNGVHALRGNGLRP